MFEGKSMSTSDALTEGHIEQVGGGETVLAYADAGLVYPDGTVALRDVDLAVREREFLAIVGPSGCGKSTLLNLAAGLLEPSVGTVDFRGRRVQGPNQQVGYITQKDLLLPWRTVRQNVALPLRLRGVSRRDTESRVADVLAQVGLSGFEESFPSTLSGGMRKRTTIARTLVYRPAVYLLDEPFSALDAQLRMVMHAELLRLHASTGATFVLVTHDLGEAVTLADRVIVMTRRPARILHEEEIHLPHPRDPVTSPRDPVYHDHVRSLWDRLQGQLSSEDLGDEGTAAR